MTHGLLAALVILVAAALAAATYFLRRRTAPAPWLAVAGRAMAWGAIALLLLNPACGRRDDAAMPLVLLDISPSMEAGTSRAAAARARADSLGEVVEFSGSRLRPALAAAAASGRPVVVITDGEIRDAAELPAGLLRTATVTLLPRPEVAYLAIEMASAPRWLPAGDTLVVRLVVRRFGTMEASPVVELREGDRMLARAGVALDAAGRGEALLEVPGGTLAPGDRALDLVLADPADAEPRTDRRRLLVTVMPSPGIVLVAARPGWESRFLREVLGEVAGVPVRGFVQVEPETWRVMGSLLPAGTAQVAEAVRRADLVVTLGDGVPGLAASGARGRWEWPAAEPLHGDWYLQADPGAPGMGGLAGIPAESLPPAAALAPLAPPPGGWVGVRAQLSRRGAERPAVVAVVEGPRRRVVVGASGLWRWAFRGGLAEQAYRVWVAETTSWLLAASGTDGGAVQVERPVVARDEPVVFRRRPGVAESPVTVTWVGPAPREPDTLAFDGGGRSGLELPPGLWTWRATTGDSGTAIVEEYSPEFLPSPPTLAAGEAALAPAGPARYPREQPWLFALPVLAWCLEWWARRRSGLR